MIFPKIYQYIQTFSPDLISQNRKVTLEPLVAYIQKKIIENKPIRLNFICTHNSRRSHFSQIWAQIWAYHFGIDNVICYSGGTEATALYPKVVETLQNQGFEILKLSDTSNPVYAVKFAPNEAPIISFSKTYDYSFNPKDSFCAIMTCSNADEDCPIVFGADARFTIRYDDPKAFDGTDLQTQKYAECSLEIAQEFWWVFGEVVKMDLTINKQKKS